jgi:hypothetical protein
VVEKTEVHGIGLRYKVRYFDPDGQERARSFPDRQKKRAEDFLIEIESDKREGKYVDPRAGRVSFKTVAERWADAQTFDYTTRERVKSRVAKHLVPFFAGKSVGAIKPSDVQAWLRWLQENQVSVNSRVLYFTHLVSVLNFAKEDKLIVTNPAQSKSVMRPREDHSQVQPWSSERAQIVLTALPARYRPMIQIPAGLGLRQGEVFASRSMTSTGRGYRAGGTAGADRAERVDVRSAEAGKTREVPIGAALLAELDRYAKEFPPTPVTLPRVHPGGKPVTVNLLMVDLDGVPFRRGGFRLGVWLPALKRAGIVNPTRADGCTLCGICTLRCCSTRGSRSRLCPATSGTRTPASPCASTRTCCRRVMSEPEARSTPSLGRSLTRTKSQAVTRRRDGLATPWTRSTRV